MSIKIESTIINNMDIKILSELKTGFQINISVKSKIRPPKDIESKKVALEVMMDLADVESKIITIHLDSLLLFHVDSFIEDYNQFAADNCIPEAINVLFDKIDSFLEIMGYKKLELSKANLLNNSVD